MKGRFFVAQIMGVFLKKPIKNPKKELLVDLSCTELCDVLLKENINSLIG